MVADRQYKKLKKAYRKVLQGITVQSFNNKASLLDYLYTYLQYLRDEALLNCLGDPKNDKTVAALYTATEEYKAYCTCITKYYDISRNVPVRLDTAKSDAEVAQLYGAERLTHWRAFWSIIKEHMEDWIVDYESAIYKS